MSKIVEINEWFSYTTDNYNWILMEYEESIKKTGEIGKSERRTYYPSLEKLLLSAFDKMVKREMRNVSDIGMVLKKIEDVKNEIMIACKS